MARELALIGVIWLGMGPILAGSTPELRGDMFHDALPGLVIGARYDEPCPADSITGQFPSACGTTLWWFYSDLNFYSGTMSRRVRCEDFPKTGVLDPNDPNHAIGVISWYGVNVDPNVNGCTKGQPGTYQFRIRFYGDNAGVPDPNFVYEEIVTPLMTDTGETVLFAGATIPAIRWGYAATLTTPRQMAHGWFSICGQGVPGCYSLWEGSGSDGGDNKFYQWWEVNGTIPGPPVTTQCDLNYCFGVSRTGACCNGATGVCENNVPELACRDPYEQFYLNTMCDLLEPPCSTAVTGACCCLDGSCFILTHFECISFPCGTPPPSCRGDANCDQVRNFDDINPFVAVLYGGPCCDLTGASCDVNNDGVINFDDIGPFIDYLGQSCWPPRTGGIWLGPGTTCDQCVPYCYFDCNDPDLGVTHPEQELCGQDTNGGCNSATDPNDPGTVDPNAWEDLGVLDPNNPTVVCGTLWADDGTRDTDWYKFRLPIQGTLSWETQSVIPLLSTPVFGDANIGAPTIPVNCGPNASLWGYWNSPRSYLCDLGGISPTDVFPAGPTYWWIAFPDSGSAIFYGFPCADNWIYYLLTITTVPLLCDPCLQADPQEGEPECLPTGDVFNSGCDSTDGLFHVQNALTPATYYCGKSGTWADPNGDALVDYDWWKIVLTGTVKKRLLIQMRAAFNVQWELYSVPGDVCANKVRLDYYEFGACEANVSIHTTCLDPNATYYMRMVPTGTVDCTQHNHYRFQYSVVTEAPACTTCSVTCTTDIDDACQSNPNDPETNAGCNGEMPPGSFMAFTAGDNTYGAKYCGRISTFTGGDGTPRADLDWFRYTQPASRTKLVIRGKAMFRMSINIANGCTDPNNVTHGWDRPCKGTTTAATHTWTGLIPSTLYTGVILYGNGGGDGTGEQPLKQFFYGLPCSDSRNNYELELQAQA